MRPEKKVGEVRVFKQKVFSAEQVIKVRVRGMSGWVWCLESVTATLIHIY